MDLDLQHAYSPGGTAPSAALEESGALSLQDSLTEQDVQYSAQAKKEFGDRNLEACLNALGTLRLSRPDDPLVAHNVAVVRFEKREIGVVEMASELGAVHDALGAKQDGGAAEMDESEHVALTYNLALTNFFRRNYERTHKILKGLHATLTNAASASSGSSSRQQQQSEEALHHFVLPLLTSVSLLLHMPLPAIAYLNQMDKGRAGAGGTGSLGSVGRAHGSSVLMRAQALVMSRQQKTFKKDVKSSDLELGEQLTADFLKANMEYLKGNLRKTLKLLTPSNERKSALTPYLQSLYYNNLGCINLMLGKPSLSLFYIIRAFNEHHTQLTSAKESSALELQKRSDYMLMVRKAEILYNQSLAQLHCGSYQEAFNGFLLCVETLRTSPHLWLHMAECCVAACTKDDQQLKDLLKKGGGIEKGEDRDKLMENFKVLGNWGQKQKVTLCPTDARPTGSDHNIFNGDPGSSPSKPALTFAYAALCLQNSLQLLSQTERFPESPNRVNVSSKLTLLRAVTLVKSSFVALRLHNPVMAVSYAQEALHLPRNAVPGGYIALAQLYCAEGLILLDQISEAAALLDPPVITDVSFDFDSLKDEGGSDAIARDSKRSPTAAAHAVKAFKAVFHFNCAVAHLHRGLLDKADTALESLWRGHSSQQLAAKVFMAKLYVQIKKGNIEKCRDLIQKNCLHGF